MKEFIRNTDRFEVLFALTMVVVGLVFAKFVYEFVRLDHVITAAFWNIFCRSLSFIVGAFVAALSCTILMTWLLLKKKNA